MTTTSTTTAATAVENPDAGQGPVLLDIGGDVGALIVTMPADSEGLEVEIRPLGATAARLAGGVADHHDHGHDHHDHGHHEADHRHDHGPSAFPHVAVVGRRAPAGVRHSLVYPSLRAGDYELCPMPGDGILLTATILGGEVTQLEVTTPRAGDGSPAARQG